MSVSGVDIIIQTKVIYSSTCFSSIDDYNPKLNSQILELTLQFVMLRPEPLDFFRLNDWTWRLLFFCFFFFVFFFKFYNQFIHNKRIYMYIWWVWLLTGVWYTMGFNYAQMCLLHMCIYLNRKSRYIFFLNIKCTLQLFIHYYRLNQINISSIFNISQINCSARVLLSMNRSYCLDC